MLGLSSELALGFSGLKERIVADGFLDFVVAAVGGVVGQYVQDKALFNRLFHGIEVEGDKLAVWGLLTKFF